MQTECVRCHKMIDTVQGYKFSPTEYLCMSCYDEYKAERVARAKKQQKNPLLDQFGAKNGGTAAVSRTPKHVAPAAEPQPSVQQSIPEPAETPPEAAPAPAEPAAPPQAQPPPRAAEVCDVCRKPITDFKVPLRGGKKVCWDCNDILRDVAKSLILTVQCPHCGKEIQLAKE